MKRRSTTLAVAIAAMFFAISGAGFAANHDLAKPSTRATINSSDTTPISLPERLGSFEDFLAVTKRFHVSARVLASQQRLQADTTRLTVAAYSRAYGGAATAFREYSDAAEKHVVGVIAVRAPSPGLTIGPVNNPADEGLAANQQSVQLFGDVECVVDIVNFVAAGHPVSPSDVDYRQCQRTGPHLTVAVFVGGTNTGAAGQRTAVQLTDGAYDAVAGG